MVKGPIHPERTHYEWQLSNDERVRLREILSGFDTYCVNEFISHFQHLCQSILTCSEMEGFYRRPRKEDKKKKLLTAIKDLEKARAIAKRIKKRAYFSVFAIWFSRTSRF